MRLNKSYNEKAGIRDIYVARGIEYFLFNSYPRVRTEEIIGIVGDVELALL